MLVSFVALRDALSSATRTTCQPSTGLQVSRVTVAGNLSAEREPQFSDLLGISSGEVPRESSAKALLSFFAPIRGERCLQVMDDDSWTNMYTVVATGG